VLTVALFDDSGQLLAVGGAASLAILIITVTQLGPCVKHRHRPLRNRSARDRRHLGARGGAPGEAGRGKAERKAVRIESIDERLRLTLEAALIGLGLVSADGHWVQINERLVGMLGHGRDELMHANLTNVVAETGPAARRGRARPARTPRDHAVGE